MNKKIFLISSGAFMTVFGIMVFMMPSDRVHRLFGTVFLSGLDEAQGTIGLFFPAIGFALLLWGILGRK